MSAKGPYGPLRPQPAHEYMREQESSVLALAEREGWGRLLSQCFVGNSVRYTFERGSTSIELPPNARRS